MFDYEKLKAAREIEAAIRARYVAELELARAYELSIRAKIERIILEGRKITGFPYQGTAWWINWGRSAIGPQTARIRIETMDGEGEWTIKSTHRIPTRWLNLPTEEWVAELRARRQKKLDWREREERCRREVYEEARTVIEAACAANPSLAAALAYTKRATL